MTREDRTSVEIYKKFAVFRRPFPLLFCLEKFPPEQEAPSQVSFVAVILGSTFAISH